MCQLISQVVYQLYKNQQDGTLLLRIHRSKKEKLIITLKLRVGNYKLTYAFRGVRLPADNILLT